jgi:hypothetical protein
MFSPPLIPNLYEMKVARALIRTCANDRRLAWYYPHEQAEVISFFGHVDPEPTGEDVRRARAEFQNLVIGVMSDIRRAKKAAHARLAALEREFTYGPPEERGPVVRSTWQRTQENTDPGPVQDAPMLRFGAANVLDLPLSMQESSATPSEATVIPQQALKNHAKGSEARGKRR